MIDRRNWVGMSTSTQKALLRVAWGWNGCTPEGDVRSILSFLQSTVFVRHRSHLNAFMRPRLRPCRVGSRSDRCCPHLNCSCTEE